MTIRKQIDVEELVTWAMLNQGMGWSSGQSSGASLAELGTRIDRSSTSAPSIALQTDDDALVVMEVIRTLPDDVAEMLIRYGRIGSRPDWCEEGIGEWRHKIGANGRPAFHFAKPGDRRSEKKPVMEFVGWRKEQVEYWRATYRVWWHGLGAIVDPLNAKLQRHQARPPAAPLEPWDQAKPVIHGPDGPIERPSASARRVSDEYVEMGSVKVKRARLAQGA